MSSKFDHEIFVKNTGLDLSQEYDLKSFIQSTVTTMRERDTFKLPMLKLRKKIEEILGPGWNLILGKSFGFDIDHEDKKVFHIHYKDFSCLIYKI
eukprot:snap_masked-scaffold_9-processed-gene-10.17-mRNA-1 protein AED:1.00 eAED:1.00 QI:0/0/0/0/1/1/3/0/94